MANLLIAAFLAFLTLLGLYAIWYIVRGRYLAQKKTQESREREKKTKDAQKAVNKKENIGKASYCYPKINDVMGYDLVKVVNVPGNLVENKPVSETKPEEPKPWGQSAGIGMSKRSVSAVNDDELRRIRMQAEGNDSSGIPFEDGVRIPKPQDISVEDNNGDGDTIDETTELNDISAQDIEELPMQGESWPSRDYWSEEEMNNINNVLDANPDKIDSPVETQDSKIVLEEMEAQKRMADFHQRELDYDAREGEDLANRLIDDEEA